MWFFTFVTVCLRSKKQNKQHYNCLALFSTIARFELEPQIRETQSYQTSSSGNMPRRNLHCKYYVLKHITIQALEATQSQGDGLPNLMELRFADDILLFANSGPEGAQLLDKLITAVGRAGLILNA